MAQLQQSILLEAGATSRQPMLEPDTACSMM
jgi:hypothetical protein